MIVLFTQSLVDAVVFQCSQPALNKFMYITCLFFPIPSFPLPPTIYHTNIVAVTVRVYISVQ